MGKHRTNIKNQIREMLLKKQSGVCFYCRKPLLLEDATIDHITPKSKGGSYALENLVAACRPCNQEKGSMHPFDYLISLN